MKLHWQILVALLAGVAVGGVFQVVLEAPPWIGAGLQDAPDGGAVVERVVAGGPADKAGLRVGAVVRRMTVRRGDPENERRWDVLRAEDAGRALAEVPVGEILWLEVAGRPRALSVAVDMDPASPRKAWTAPFAFVADLFLALLKMLIVPIILTSIITGVAGVSAAGELERLGLKTFAYYLLTSLLAACTGLALVNLVRPGDGAALGLELTGDLEDVTRQSFWGILQRMVPENVFTAFSDNGQMLQVIFFALLFGYFLTKVGEPHRSRLQGFFEAAFAVVMRLASAILKLIPYGVFALLVKVVGETGFGLFKYLGLYMATVAGGLLLHALVTLPLLLRLVGRVSPARWGQAMSPALVTAFSTSSSSLTLPVTLETVERRGRVSNKTTSFVLPLGATINMDGTALYECVGVIFLAQYYASAGGHVLTMGDQVLVVVMALMASVGAAGIPSAGLVMMLTILSSLGLPIEGAALLLAVDRPLDMMRTVVNVWSDSCGAALIARTEGETPLLETPDSS